MAKPPLLSTGNAMPAGQQAWCVHTLGPNIESMQQHANHKLVRFGGAADRGQAGHRVPWCMVCSMH